MEISGSKWSSGCESRWTDYLLESYHSPNQFQNKTNFYDHENSFRAISYEDEEDLSMVSDASSRPPYFRHNEEEEVECFRKFGFSGSLSKEKSKRIKTKDSCLDDTASSPAFNFPKGFVDSSNNQQSIIHGVENENSPLFGYRFGFSEPSYTKRMNSIEPSVFRGRRKRG